MGATAEPSSRLACLYREFDDARGTIFNPCLLAIAGHEICNGGPSRAHLCLQKVAGLHQLWRTLKKRGFSDKPSFVLRRELPRKTNTMQEPSRRESLSRERWSGIQQSTKITARWKMTLHYRFLWRICQQQKSRWQDASSNTMATDLGAKEAFADIFFQKHLQKNHPSTLKRSDLFNYPFIRNSLMPILVLVFSPWVLTNILG